MVNMLKMQVKKLLFIIITVASITVATVLFVYYRDYFSIKTKVNITSQEFDIISEEYKLRIEKQRIDWIYHQGSDRNGVRFELSNYDANQIDDCFFYRFDVDKMSVFLQSNNWHEYTNSNGQNVEATEISNYVIDSPTSGLFIYLFQENGKWYIEVEKDRVSYTIDFK